MNPPVVKVLRAASVLLCLTVALSVLLFAVNQTSTASGHQQEQLSERVSAPHRASHEGSVHRTIDEVAEAVTSPVSNATSSEWGEHGIRLLFALVVYGFGLGYVARLLRIRT